MYMEVSSCCGAPLVSRIQPDPTNFSDDDYELVVKVWVCSNCNAVMEIEKKGGRRHDTAQNGDPTGGITESDHT